MTSKVKKWLLGLATGLVALTIGVVKYDVNPVSAISGNLNDRIRAMFVDVVGFQTTGIRVISATESSAALPGNINDRWRQAFASCGAGLTCLRVVDFTGGAPIDAEYITLALDATLTDERVLIGTANQIILFDGGANGNLTLTTPQDIALVSSPTFASLSLNNAANQILLDADGTFTGQITMDTLAASRTYTFPDASGEVTLLGQLIDLASEVTGTLPVGNGGTGQSTYTKGDILVATDATTLVKLAVGVNGDILTVDSVQSEGVKYDSITDIVGNTGVIRTTSADVTVVNTTTETTIFTFTIPANTLGTDNSTRLFIQGRVTDNTGGGAQLLTVRLKYGATTVATRIIESVTGITDQGYPFMFALMADGATNAQEAMMKLQRDLASASTVPTNIARGTAAEDSTTALALAVTVQWDLADANLSYTMEHAVLEVLNAS